MTRLLPANLQYKLCHKQVCIHAWVCFWALSHPVTLRLRLNFFTGMFHSDQNTVDIQNTDGAPGKWILLNAWWKENEFLPLSPLHSSATLALTVLEDAEPLPDLRFLHLLFPVLPQMLFHRLNIQLSPPRTARILSCFLLRIYPLRFISIFILLFASSIPQYQEYEFLKFTIIGFVHCLISGTSCVVHTQ